MPHHDIDRFASDLIRRKARQLIGRAGLRSHDLADVCQELTLRFLRRLPASKAGDPGHEAMTTAAIRQCVANLLRDRKALKRDGWEVGSLNVSVDDGDGAKIALADALDRRQQDARLGVRPRTEEDSAQLTADVRAVLAALPDDLRVTAERLMTQSVAESARELGMPRMTLYQKVRQLRKRFERAGLKDYLELSSSPGARAG